MESLSNRREFLQGIISGQSDEPILSLEDTINVQGSFQQPAELTRREVLGWVGNIAVGTAASSLLSAGETEAQGTNRERAFLYDIFVSSFDAFKDKAYDARKVNGERQRILAMINPGLKPFLKVDSSKVKHRFYLDVDTIAGHADTIAAELNKTGAAKGAYKQQRRVYFNPNSTSGVFANVLVDTDIGTAVRELSTAYTPSDIQATTTALVKEVYNGRYPRKGELVRFPVRFLKLALSTGMKEGVDYHEFKLNPGQTFHNLISTYTQGDYAKNVAAVLKFNSINPNEIGSLSAGTAILVPREIYKNPLNPIITEEKSPGKYAIVPEPKPKDPSGAPPGIAKQEADERDDAIKGKIPELAGSASQYIDDVIAQNLMVLGQTKMPAVLTEAFNMKNNDQLNFYKRDANINVLAESYGRGIIQYIRANPHVTKVITDNGHGKGDPGAPSQDGTLSEGDFTGKIWKHLSEFLRSERQRLGMKFEVFPLNYEGDGKQRARLSWYVDQANRINNEINGKDDSIYIPIHVNSARPNFEPPPQARVHGKGPQPKSTELGAHILSFAVPWYQANFRH